MRTLGIGWRYGNAPLRVRSNAHDTEIADLDPSLLVEGTLLTMALSMHALLLCQLLQLGLRATTTPAILQRHALRAKQLRGEHAKVGELTTSQMPQSPGSGLRTLGNDSFSTRRRSVSEGAVASEPPSLIHAAAASP